MQERKCVGGGMREGKGGREREGGVPNTDCRANAEFPVFCRLTHVQMQTQCAP